MTGFHEATTENPQVVDRSRPAKPISVCLLISSLEFGGAERQVVEMARSFDRTWIKPFVCSLSKSVPLARFLSQTGEDLFGIVERRGRFDLTTITRVARLLRARDIDLVHAFLFDAEIVARLAAPIAGFPVVVASERNTDYSRPLLHQLALRLTQPMFDTMVANSVAGKQFNMRTLRLPASRIEVVHNGVDVDRFRPDPESGCAFKARIGIPPDAPIIGMVASLKRQKGHDCFLRMAARVRQANPETHFLVVGEPMRQEAEAGARYQQEIWDLAGSLCLNGSCHFLGNQTAMNPIYNACDLTVLLSRREGTPNVVLESMACGIPVIATDVADNRHIVEHGATGFVVPPEAADAASAFAIDLIRNRQRRATMGEAARRRACTEFSLRRAADKLQVIYTNCLLRRRRLEFK